MHLADGWLESAHTWWVRNRSPTSIYVSQGLCLSAYSCKRWLACVMASVHVLGHVCPFGSTPMATICAAGIRLHATAGMLSGQDLAHTTHSETQQQPLWRDLKARQQGAVLPLAAGCGTGLSGPCIACRTAPVHVHEKAPQLSSCPRCSDGICTCWADQVLCPYQHHRHPGLPLQRDLSILHPPEQLLHCVTCMRTGLQPDCSCISQSHQTNKARQGNRNPRSRRMALPPEIASVCVV